MGLEEKEEREERRRRGEPALSGELGRRPARRCRSKAESGFLVGYFSSNSPPLLYCPRTDKSQLHSCACHSQIEKIKQNMDTG